MRDIFRLVMVTTIAAALATGPALAHIPHASWLMGKMEHKREVMGVRSYTIEMTCGLPGQNPHKEKLLLKTPRMVRREKDDGTVIVCNKNKCREKAPGKTPVLLPSWVFVQYLFFVEKSVSADRWVRLLRSLKIDTKVNTLTRSGSRVAVVLGAKEWERDRPQLWIDKDRYLPLRLMVKEKDRLVDIQWLKWGSRTTGDWFPQTIEIHSDGELMDTCTVEHVEANKPISSDLFRLE